LKKAGGAPVERFAAHCALWEGTPRPKMPGNDSKPTTFQGNLSKLPKALSALVARPQWCVWRWERTPKGAWQKPPYMATDLQRHASTADSSTWCDYQTALSVVLSGAADGVTFILADGDPFAAIDLDHCRNPATNSIDAWAQNFLDVAGDSYVEVTPSGEGLRIWGLASADAESANRKFSLEIDGKAIAAEVFCRAGKALTITGARLGEARKLASADDLVAWAIAWGEREKAASEARKPNGHAPVNGREFGGSGLGVDYVDQAIREGAPAGANRSDTFHAIVGHLLGCGLDAVEIEARLRQHPEGIGARYIAEDRLGQEIARSAKKFAKDALPAFAGFVPIVTPAAKPTPPPRPSQPPPPRPSQPRQATSDDDLPDPDDLLEDPVEGKPAAETMTLPEMFTYGGRAGRQADKAWLLKGLLPAVGHGLLSGQWGAFKTFVALEMAVAIATAEPFQAHRVKRQSGALLIAAEGSGEVQLRLDAIAEHKLDGASKIPFVWFDRTPALLQKGAAEMLVAMAQQADGYLRGEFDLPLGLVIVDTVSVAAGYAKSGDENDSSAVQALMNVLRTVAESLGCFVLGVDHFGKNADSGTRGSSSKEASADVVLVCLGEKTLSGVVTDARLAVRKNRSGRAGAEFPFTMREVVMGHDEDGDEVRTLVVDWLMQRPMASSGKPAPDPWTDGIRTDQRAAIKRLRAAIMESMVEKGVDLPIPPDGPIVRMVNEEIVRELFYSRTPAPGTTARQKRQVRKTQYTRALNRAEGEQQTIGIEVIGDVTYLRPVHPPREDDLGDA
jgi:hypothetical protein